MPGWTFLEEGKQWKNSFLSGGGLVRKMVHGRTSLVPRRSLLICYLGESERVSLGDITAHAGVQEWPSRKRVGTRLRKDYGSAWTYLSFQLPIVICAFKMDFKKSLVSLALTVRLPKCRRFFFFYRVPVPIETSARWQFRNGSFPRENRGDESF